MREQTSGQPGRQANQRKVENNTAKVAAASYLAEKARRTGGERVCIAAWRARQREISQAALGTPIGRADALAKEAAAARVPSANQNLTHRRRAYH